MVLKNTNKKYRSSVKVIESAGSKKFWVIVSLVSLLHMYLIKVPTGKLAHHFPKNYSIVFFKK